MTCKGPCPKLRANNPFVSTHRGFRERAAAIAGRLLPFQSALLHGYGYVLAFEREEAVEGGSGLAGAPEVEIEIFYLPAYAPAYPLFFASDACGIWDGRRDHVHFFELRLDRLPELQLDNREIISARLILPGELRGMALTGPVAAYLGRTPPPGGHP